MVKDYFSTLTEYGEVIKMIERAREEDTEIEIVFAAREERVYRIDDAAVSVGSKGNHTNFILSSRTRENITSAKSRLNEIIESKLVEGVMI